MNSVDFQSRYVTGSRKDLERRHVGETERPTDWNYFGVGLALLTSSLNVSEKRAEIFTLIFRATHVWHACSLDLWKQILSKTFVIFD